jgi:hypothetical protein
MDVNGGPANIVLGLSPNLQLVSSAGSREGNARESAIDSRTSLLYLAGLVVLACLVLTCRVWLGIVHLEVELVT